MSTHHLASGIDTTGRPTTIGPEADQAHLLRIYLRDHEAAAVGGLQLFRRCLNANRGTLYEADLGRLTSSVRADRDDLRNICRRCGVRFSNVRRAVAFTGTVVGRLKLNGRLLRYSPLSRVIELEALTAGVMCKLRLWESLRRAAAADQRLDDDELARHATDAQDQLDVLRRLHDLAADETFKPASTR